MRTSITRNVFAGWLTLLYFTSACGSEGPAGPPAIATITISPVEPTVFQSDTVRLKSEVKSSSGAVLTDRSVTWTSASPAIATVGSTSGLITGVQAGTALITATSEGKTATVALTVKLSPCDAIFVLPITSSVPANGTLSATDCKFFQDASYADLYRFDLTATTRVEVKLHSTFDTYLEIYRYSSTEFTRVGANDDVDATTTDSRLVGSLSAGSYLIVANGFDIGPNDVILAVTGPYSLTYTAPYTGAIVSPQLLNQDSSGRALTRVSPTDARVLLRRGLLQPRN